MGSYLMFIHGSWCDPLTLDDKCTVGITAFAPRALAFIFMILDIHGFLVMTHTDCMICGSSKLNNLLGGQNLYQ